MYVWLAFTQLRTEQILKQKLEAATETPRPQLQSNMSEWWLGLWTRWLWRPGQGWDRFCLGFLNGQGLHPEGGQEHGSEEWPCSEARSEQGRG